MSLPIVVRRREQHMFESVSSAWFCFCTSSSEAKSGPCPDDIPSLDELWLLIAGFVKSIT